MSKRVKQWARRGVIGAAVAAAAALTPAGTEAAEFGFSCITGNVAAQCSAGETQLYVDVSQYGDPSLNLVAFRFGVNAGADMSVTMIQFEGDDAFFDTRFNMFEASNASSVDFDGDATPGQLPGGNQPSVNFIGAWGATRNTGDGIDWGINPGEWLNIVFALTGAASQNPYQTVQTIVQALQTGAMRIGLHVQSIGQTDGSEGFLNGRTPRSPGEPGNPVPEPASLVLLGSGLAGVAEAARRRRKARAAA